MGHGAGGSQGYAQLFLAYLYIPYPQHEIHTNAPGMNDELFVFDLKRSFEPIYYISKTHTYLSYIFGSRTLYIQGSVVVISYLGILSY